MKAYLVWNDALTDDDAGRLIDAPDAAAAALQYAETDPEPDAYYQGRVELLVAELRPGGRWFRRVAYVVVSEAELAAK